MRYIRFACAWLLAGALVCMTACGGVGQNERTLEASSQDPQETSVPPAPVVDEICAFDRVRFEGECHTTEHLEEYLGAHLDVLLQDMSAHGIAVDDGTEIRATPIHIINLLTGSVGLHAHFLPVLERGALVNAVSVKISDDAMTVSAAVSWPWMSQVDRVLKEHPQETYLLANCLVRGWNYICLISSQNEITYIVRPNGGGELPFEKDVDYFSKLYDERLAISYDKIYAK